MTNADLVWNRAALENGGASPRGGDKALAALLLAHGLVMNGGVRHACSSLDPEELQAAASGYRFFGFEEIAALLERSTSSEESEFDDDGAVDSLDQDYAVTIPDDGVILARFNAVFAASPTVFSPL